MLGLSCEQGRLAVPPGGCTLGRRTAIVLHVPGLAIAAAHAAFAVAVSPAPDDGLCEPCSKSAARCACEAAVKIARLSSFSTLIHDPTYAAWSARTSGVRSRSAQRNAEPSSATYPDSQAKIKNSEGRHLRSTSFGCCAARHRCEEFGGHIAAGAATIRRSISSSLLAGVALVG
jgi:hypothetical protein